CGGARRRRSRFARGVADGRGAREREGVSSARPVVPRDESRDGGVRPWWDDAPGGTVEDRRVPFTLSHPAAVLPFVRAPFVPAALVAGALAPDVPYFVRLPRSADAWYEPFVNATTTHQPLGALG